MVRRHITSIYRCLVAIVLLVVVGCTPGRPPPTPIPPDLRVIGMEVTQAIQDLNNSVLLVAGKRTFVRIYVYRDYINHIDPPYIAASLEGFQNGISLGAPLSPANSGGGIYVTGEGGRHNLNDAFYFELPASWIRAGQLTLTATVDPSHVLRENDYSNNSISKVVTFQPGKALRLRFVQYSYLRDGARISPSQFDLDEIISQMRRIYPIPWLNYQRFIVLANCGGGTDQISPSPCNSTWPTLGDRIPNTWNVEEILLGLRQTYEPNDPDALYYGLYAVPAGGWYPFLGEAWWYDRTAVGWSYAGTTVLGDTLYNPGRIGIHEVGHLLGRSHVMCRGDEILPVDASYPYYGGQIGTGTDASFWGFDSGDPGLNPSFTLRIIPSDWVDFMSYCDKYWISDYTYTGIYNYIQTMKGVTMLESPSNAPPALQNIAYTIVPLDDEEGDYLSVYGTVDISEQVASLSFLSRQTKVTKIPPREPGAYHILLLDAQNKRLADYAFTPLDSSDGDTRRVIAQIVPFVPGTRRLAIYSDVAGREITSVSVSANPPDVSGLKLDVDARLPVSAPVVLNWKGNDPDGDRLSYTLLYSFDAGQTWRVVATGIAETIFSVDTAQLEGTKMGSFRLIANDGVNTGFADSVLFEVEGKPPVVRISNPANDNSYVYGQTVTLEGYGQDIEDGTLDDSHLSWSSDRDGSLGAGHLIYPSLLSVGTHTITLTASDSAEQTGTATANIIITQQ